MLEKNDLVGAFSTWLQCQRGIYISQISKLIKHFYFKSSYEVLLGKRLKFLEPINNVILRSSISNSRTFPNVLKWRIRVNIGMSAGVFSKYLRHIFSKYLRR